MGFIKSLKSKVLGEEPKKPILPSLNLHSVVINPTDFPSDGQNEFQKTHIDVGEPAVGSQKFEDMTVEDIMARVIMTPGTQLKGNSLAFVETKRIPSSFLLMILKRLRSFEEQNRHLQKYLKVMVTENESLQGQLADQKETLTQAKSSLAEIAEEFEVFQKMQMEQH
mmetsp:Transcript_17010/g.28747  ORF Transcript_17010/g.28747 Transcript_17010/m.28747 type:complete len:167 (+) Transcript_17010:21-521(+)